MKKIYAFAVLAGVYLLLGLFGCSVFKKTSKASVSSKQESSKEGESVKLDLKTTGKETRIYTYWNDSVLYQYQDIKEQVDQMKVDREKLKEKQNSEQKREVAQRQVEKEGGLSKVWVYAGLAVFIVMLSFIHRSKIYTSLKNSGL